MIFVPDYAKEMGFSLSNLRRKPRCIDFDGKPIYADGGLVGKQIVFERYGEERIGKITEDLGDGRLSVVSGSGSYAITPEKIVSFIDTPEKKKGWFGFKDGGKLVYHNGRQYPTGSAWAVEHNHRNKSEKWEQYDAGGPVGQMNNAKSYWNRFDKKRKIDFLISAGFSKSVANDLSNENWDTLEPTVHKKLLAVLMVNGGPVETSEQKYRLLSPDGFDIEMDAVYTKSELMPAFEKFKKRFEKQGYYSTSNRTKIDLRDLQDYMQVVEYNEIEDYD